MTKFRLILLSLIAASMLTAFYLVIVHGVSLSFSYLGPNAEYPHRWTGGILLVSILFALASSLTLYFTFFELYEDDEGKLRFKNPDNFLLRFVLKDKLTKPVSSCALFWRVAGHSSYLCVAIFMPIYSVSVIRYIRRNGFELESLVLLGICAWLMVVIWRDIFSKSELVNKLSSNPWFQKIGYAFMAVIVVMSIMKNPVMLIYVFLAFLGGAAVVLISMWLTGKSSKYSLFKNKDSGKSGNCPIIYPKDGEQNENLF